MRDFTKLRVWQKAHELALEIYSTTQLFPHEERFGLSAHLRKTGISISSNIAEGCGRDSDAELVRFLSIAAGSASEAECQVLLARDLKFLSGETTNGLTNRIREIRRMLFGLKQSLKSADSQHLKSDTDS